MATTVTDERAAIETRIELRSPVVSRFPDERLEAIPTTKLIVEEERTGGGLHGRGS
jgi:hypothetical protein